MDISEEFLLAIAWMHDLLDFVPRLCRDNISLLFSRGCSGICRQREKPAMTLFLPTKRHARASVHLEILQECNLDRGLRGTAQIKTLIPGLFLYTDFVRGHEEADILAFLDETEQCAS